MVQTVGQNTNGDVDKQQLEVLLSSHIQVFKLNSLFNLEHVVGFFILFLFVY